MQTSKNVNVKKDVTKKIAILKKDASLTKSNLQQFADKLKDYEGKEKNVKSLLYIYPENWNAIQINSDLGSSFRGNKRRLLQNFNDNIFIYTKTNDVEKLNNEIKLFDIFYKQFFKSNDYTLNSLTHTKGEKSASLQMMLDIIKASK